MKRKCAGYEGKEKKKGDEFKVMGLQGHIVDKFREKGFFIKE